MTKQFILMILVLIVCSCSTTDLSVDNQTYHQDFDNLKMWARDAAVTDAQAHSGKYSAYTDEAHEFSQTFEMSYDFAKLRGYKSMIVTTWCMMNDIDCQSAFVTSIESPGQTLLYKSHELKKFLNMPLAWGKYSTYIKLPDTAPEKTNIKVYLWSSEKQKAWMDDVTIKFNKH